MKPILTTLALLWAIVPAAAQDAARMEQVIQSRVQDKTFMGSVLVARGGDVILSESYGMANLEWDVPNTPSTKFRLGSITKQFTAASILLLEERGKLRTSDPIKKYVPDAPAAWDPITLHHLLTHTSGIPNFTAAPEYTTMKGVNTPVETAVKSFLNKPLDFAVGERMSYSNSGYLVLGLVIERVAGMTYEKFLQDNIFTPLAMTGSGYDSNARIIPHRAAGYSPVAAGGRINAGFVHMSVPHAAGALYSTTADLLKWQQGLFGGKVISAASLQKMTTPDKSDYAYGVIVTTRDARKRIVHGGGIDGFNTSLSYFPDSKTTVVVLANLNGPVADQLNAQLGILAHGGTVTLTTERREIKVPAATLNRYAGVYDMGQGMTLTVTFEGEQLFAQMTKQPRFELFAESETAFFLKVVDAQVEFVHGAGGGVSHLVLHQNGRDLKGTRQP